MPYRTTGIYRCSLPLSRTLCIAEVYGAGGGIRTRTGAPADFKSAASAIPPPRHCKHVWAWAIKRVRHLLIRAVRWAMVVRREPILETMASKASLASASSLSNACMLACSSAKAASRCLWASMFPSLQIGNSFFVNCQSLPDWTADYAF